MMYYILFFISLQTCPTLKDISSEKRKNTNTEHANTRSQGCNQAAYQHQINTCQYQKMASIRQCQRIGRRVMRLSSSDSQKILLTPLHLDLSLRHASAVANSPPNISNEIHTSNHSRLDGASLTGPLASAFRKVASSNPGQHYKTGDDEEKMKLELSSFINNFFRAQMDGKSSSEAVYNPAVLDLYDAYVWQFNSPFLWRIIEDEIQEMYEQNVNDVHCEVATGTGLFLKNLSPMKLPTRLTLIDLSEHSLFSCSERVKEVAVANGQDAAGDNIHIQKAVADVTKSDSIQVHKGKHQSVAANFLLHCLHGENLLDKADAVKGCASLLSQDEDACFFGSTILGRDILDDAENAGAATIKTLEEYNEWGIFGNMGDKYEDLQMLLNETFHDVEVHRSGYCGVWKARQPKSK